MHYTAVLKEQEKTLWEQQGNKEMNDILLECNQQIGKQMKQ
jgi:tRNA U54 and U55 pseudouridine synthase Pus10